MNMTHDFKGLTDWIEIFRGGQQTDSTGRVHNFTTGDLDSIIANYDPAHPAPHVITHNEMYSPFRYGEVVELKREGDVLFARSDNIEPQFESLVKNRNLPDRSVRIKPVDGGLKLDHIAWLGAEPPAVEGMAPVQFSAPADGEFDFISGDAAADSYTPNVLSRFMRRIRDVWIDKFSLEEADKLLPEYEIDSIKDHANALRKPPEFTGDQRAFSINEGDDFSPPNNNTNGDVAMTQFTQEQVDDQIKKAVEEATADFTAKQKEAEKALSDERKKRLAAEFKKETDSLLDEGKLTPAQVQGMSDFKLQLADSEGVQFEFSKGDGDKAETVKVTLLDWFRDFTAKLGKQVDMGESAASDDSLDTNDAEAIASSAVDYQKSQQAKGITVSMSDAVHHVTKNQE